MGAKHIIKGIVSSGVIHDEDGAAQMVYEWLYELLEKVEDGTFVTITVEFGSLGKGAEVEQVGRVQNLIRDAVDFMREKATDEEIVAAFIAETIEILSSYPEEQRKAAIKRIDEGSRRGG